jgi:hypothetical protein
MKFSLAKMIISLASVFAFVQGAIAATPVSVTVWETSGTVDAKTFNWNDPLLNQSRGLPLTIMNADFLGVYSDAIEAYDIYHSTPTGELSESGACLTIVGQWNGTGAGFNIARVDLNMSDNTVKYFSVVTSFTMGTTGGISGSEANAVDADTATATGFGRAIGQNVMRIVVCEPKDLFPPQNPCCPPWSADTLADMMKLYKSPGLSGDYTMIFQPTATFKSQMQSYIEYLHSTNPAITSITIDWALYDQGTGTVPMGWPNGSSPGNNGTMISGYYFRTWKENGPNNPTIEPLNPPSSFFPGFPMQAGTHYKIHTGIYTDGPKFFSDECANNDIYVIRYKGKLQSFQISNNKGRIIKTDRIKE